MERLAETSVVLWVVELIPLFDWFIYVLSENCKRTGVRGSNCIMNVKGRFDAQDLVVEGLLLAFLGERDFMSNRPYGVTSVLLLSWRTPPPPKLHAMMQAALWSHV